MKILDLKQLDYLHDAIVRQIAFALTDTRKDLVVTVTCDDDCGYSDWCGKTLIITLANLLQASGTFLGHVAGYETVQSFDEGASADMSQKIQQLSKIGIAPPNIVLRFTLHSGSEFEIACDSIAIRSAE